MRRRALLFAAIAAAIAWPARRAVAQPTGGSPSTPKVTPVSFDVDRVLWGSDWPHPDSRVVPGRQPTDIAPALPVDDGFMLSLVPRWVPDTTARRKILVTNPARLYGFSR